MRKKPNASWNYYQWDPTEFRLDNRIRKLDGSDIAILRAIHDAIWMTGEQRILDDICTIAQIIDIPIQQVEDAIERLLKSKALYEKNGFICSPHIDECWNHCQYVSEKARQNRLKAIEKQKECNGR
jgi:hypothetical protein